MKRSLSFALFAVAGVACSGSSSPTVLAVQQQLMFVDIAEPDSISVNGICSLREAWRVIANGVPSADCGTDDGSHTITLGAGTWQLALPNPIPVASEDTSSATGDLDITGNTSITIQGAGSALTVLDGGDLDRIIHAKGLASVTLRDITLRNGCVNGGNCATATAGSEPTGGLVYCNAAGTCLFERVRFTDGHARNGGALGFCAAVQGSYAAIECEFTGNTATQAGGAVQGHVDATFEGCSFSDNVAGTLGGALQWYDRTATLTDSTITGNTATLAGGGWAATGQWNASTAGHVEQVGGVLQGNTAGQKGGNAYVGGIGAQGQGGLYSAPCSAVGCSGGVSAIAVSGGTAPSGPDCSGFLDLFAGSTVANPAGCSPVQQGPVCGNGVIESGEQCDGGQCCTASCVLAAAGSSCDDGDECTPDDECDAAGECVPGGTTCGDGVVQTQCGEMAVEQCAG